VIVWLSELNPVLQAFIAGLFTWGVTSLGAAGVLLMKTVNRKLLDCMLGFAAGVMIAASYWSLLAPAIELAADDPLFPRWVSPTIGFLFGGLFLFAIDKILPHLHLGEDTSSAEGPKTSWHRSVLLVLAITLHNIPEGLSIGVAFGAAASGLPGATIASAVVLAIGIGLQNFPEGLAVSAPLRREGLSPVKSFWYGQLSGMVEPFAAIVGAAVVMIATPILPYALSFAAGAMIFVVVEELIPESQLGGNKDLATLSTMLGFSVMMVLDVALG